VYSPQSTNEGCRSTRHVIRLSQHSQPGKQIGLRIVARTPTQKSALDQPARIVMKAIGTRLIKVFSDTRVTATAWHARFAMGIIC
jgi:hypothetical protein